ncbi:MAG: hypothetical protein FJ297_08475 [Planctomycetes bacterium]|nr:hypothetical protein [Planctomycetota bacterium]
MDSDTRNRLSREIMASAAILNRGSESVRAVMASEENRFTHALTDLQRLSHGEGIPIAIVGGLGAIRYGYPAATQDIDIGVARSQLDALVKVAPRYGFKVAWEAKSGWHTLTHGDVEINVVPEGGKARNKAPTTIPGPSKLGVQQGLDYASLRGWLELKLSSGRQKDRGHVVEVMKKAEWQSLQEAREYIAQVHQSYVELFDQLYEEAQEERKQEEQRGGAAP